MEPVLAVKDLQVAFSDDKGRSVSVDRISFQVTPGRGGLPGGGVGLRKERDLPGSHGAFGPGRARLGERPVFGKGASGPPGKGA